MEERKMIKVRYCGAACVEIIGNNDHIIIDPVYRIEPDPGITAVFVTHDHSDHVNVKSLKEIEENLVDEDVDLKVYGPKTVKSLFKEEGYEKKVHLIKENQTIELEDFVIQSYPIECYKAEECFAYIVSKGDINILHTADSAKFSERLRKTYKNIDFLFIACFEDHFEDYLDFVKAVS